MTKTILIHHHIFKNAGTSFNFALKKYFKEQFFEFDLPNSAVVTQDDVREFIDQHPQALVISSHHAAMPTPQGEDYQTISSVLLRRPLARIKSMYKFEHKQNAQTEGSIKARELTFKEYVLWRLEKTPVMFCNYQTHYCSRTNKSSLGRRIITEQDLEIAINNLKQCAVVGTVERYNDSLKLAEQKLREYYPDLILESKFINKTSLAPLDYDKIRSELIEDVGEEIVLRIEKMNELDEQLHDFVDTILNENVII